MCHGHGKDEKMYAKVSQLVTILEKTHN